MLEGTLRKQGHLWGVTDLDGYCPLRDTPEQEEDELTDPRSLRIKHLRKGTEKEGEQEEGDLRKLHQQYGGSDSTERLVAVTKSACGEFRCWAEYLQVFWHLFLTGVSVSSINPALPTGDSITKQQPATVTLPVPCS